MRSTESLLILFEMTNGSLYILPVAAPTIFMHDSEIRNVSKHGVGRPLIVNPSNQDSSSHGLDATHSRACPKEGYVILPCIKA